MQLNSEIIAVDLLTDHLKSSMYKLMVEFYDQTNYVVFLHDLKDKDYCILLYTPDNELRGFTTVKQVRFTLDDTDIFGVFSGDTIIHSDNWGSLELFKSFAKLVFELGSYHQDFYWFLISKGYRTYRMLPVFFKEFYPNYQHTTPAYEQSIINGFGMYKYPEEFDLLSGVVCYKGIKDKLKLGVADITDKQLRDKNIAYFVDKNPGYIQGNDLVCLARLHPDSLREPARRLLLGG